MYKRYTPLILSFLIIVFTFAGVMYISGTYLNYPSSHEEMSHPEDEIMVLVNKDSSHTITSLEPVNGKNGFGQVMILEKGNTQYLVISGELPPPPKGSYYSAWLSKKNEPKDKVFAGRLSLHMHGAYIVTTKTSDLFDTFTISISRKGSTNPDKDLLIGTKLPRI